MHHGHALVSSIKDTILRHKERQGYKIEYNFGFDEHGLPLEQAVEKEIGDKMDLRNPKNLSLFVIQLEVLFQNILKNGLKVSINLIVR